MKTILRPLAILLLTVLPTSAADLRFYIGPTGQTLYLRIENPAAAYVATALTEGTSGGLGNYTASEATIAALTGMSSASTGNGCSFTVRVGSPSATADDPIVAFGDLPWSGSAELRAPTDVRQFGGNGTLDAAEIGADALTAAKFATDVSTEINAALLATTNGAATVATQLARLDAAVSAASGFTEAQRAQILAALSVGTDTEVPSNRSWIIKRINGVMKAVAAVPKDTGESIKVLADFRNVLSSGDAIAPTGGIVSIALVDDGQTGTITSTAFTSVANAELWMNSAVKFTIAGGTAGQTDRIRVKVLTVGGDTLSAPCSVIVKDGE